MRQQGIGTTKLSKKTKIIAKRKTRLICRVFPFEISFVPSFPSLFPFFAS